MKFRITGILILACVCILSMAVCPVSAGLNGDSKEVDGTPSSSAVISGEDFASKYEKPVENYNPEPIEYCQNKPVENYSTKPVEYYQNKPVENYNPKPVEYCQNKPVENYSTKPVEYYQNKSVENYNPKPVEYCQNSYLNEYKKTQTGEYADTCKENTYRYEEKKYDVTPLSEKESFSDYDNYNDLTKDAISVFLDQKWEEIKEKIIEAILSGQI